MINQIATGKVIVFIEKKNNKAIQQAIACQNYINVFISPEIALLKNFKTNISNDS